MVHSYSPPLAALLGRVRVRLARCFQSVLAMSQRLQFELQRWHSHWLQVGACRAARSPRNRNRTRT